MHAISPSLRWIATGIFLLFGAFSAPNGNFQLLVFALVMVTVGIPHGAVDHLLASSTTASPWKFYLRYLGIMAAYTLLWVLAPLLALFLFLFVSAYHFGQMHLETQAQGLVQKITYSSIGFGFLGLIVFGDWQASAALLSSFFTLPDLFPYRNWIGVGSMLLLIPLYAHYPKNPRIWLAISALAISLWVLPLYLSFALYFGFWHSLPSLKIEYIGLKAKGNVGDYTNFIRNLLPFSLLSLLGIGILLVAGMRYLEPNQLMLLFFILVSLITAPHVLVMDTYIEKEFKAKRGRFVA
ncbi:beta-carotene 15,15'-monooxygenase, brp/blh family protein [Nitritalea halalkaliphila LW7]|uniref:Probable beta-carotene 15,15'-dioxygenase n=1 Tax=Nitritalea halalkaliphila LW7 TaxID=1189621 RepID=I5C7L4_9BACT|nr:beta-carotene 15,15'-dioxygenase, Brp/Blh family [Nitritalea halalkaliphila]EIM77816.1 beta-carotene 15,15'-monooxygenase, brp/blh family protein [Nitritalea halalkaliphila LW7]